VNMKSAPAELNALAQSHGMAVPFVEPTAPPSNKTAQTTEMSMANRKYPLVAK